MIAANHEEAVPVAPSAGANLPPHSRVPWLELSQNSLPTLTTVVVSTQRIELNRLLKHPAFTNQQRSTAASRIMAERNPARLGRWSINLQRQIADWEEYILAEEARRQLAITNADAQQDQKKL